MPGDPPGISYEATGVVIGPHTILTASHVVFDTTNQTVFPKQNIQIFAPGVNYSSFPDPFTAVSQGYTQYTVANTHSFEIGTLGSDLLGVLDSRWDFAVIDTSASAPAFASWLNIDPNYVTGSSAQAVGYPHSLNGPIYSAYLGLTSSTDYLVTGGGTVGVINYGISGATQPGMSGGGIYTQDAGGNYLDLVGLVSTGDWGVQLTNYDLNTIQSWVNGDGDLLGSQIDAQPPTSVINVGPADFGIGPGGFGPTGNDILWRNANGDVGLWQTNGIYRGGFSYKDLGVVPTSWQIAGTGDFNGASESGILWRNANGDTALWNSNGSGGAGGGDFTFQDLGVIDQSWQIAGTGVFSSNGAEGIFWQNANGQASIWQGVGSRVFGPTAKFVNNPLGDLSGWKAVEFPHEGAQVESSILWQGASGDLELWNPNGTGKSGQAGYNGQYLGRFANDQVIGSGDFSGKNDGFILRNTITDDVELLNPTTNGSFQLQDLGVVDRSWQLVETGHFSGATGEESLLWRNTSGDTGLWNPNGGLGGFVYEDLGKVDPSWSATKIMSDA